MTLQDAIEEVKRQVNDNEWTVDELASCTVCDTAIATILNAVVKGELK